MPVADQVPGGCFGRALVVDVGTGATEALPLPERVLREHLGGVGLGTWLLTELGACSWAGTPSGWTFGRVLSGVDDDELDQAFSGWTAQDSQPATAVAVDGKTMRVAR